MRLAQSLLFVLLCELMFIIPGGLIDIVLTFAFSHLNERVITLIGFLCSGVVLMLCLKHFFHNIFLRIKELMRIDISKLFLLIAVIVITGVLYTMIVFIGLELDLVSWKEAPLESTGILSIISLLLFAFIVTAIKELVFRGADLSYLLMRLNPWVSIVIISILLSVGHMQYSGILNCLTMFIFGVVASFTVIRTNTLYWAIGLHCGWNFANGVNNMYFDLNNKIIPQFGNTFELLRAGLLILILVSFWLYSRNQLLQRTANKTIVE